MTKHTLLVCSLCRFSETPNKNNRLSGGQHLIEELKQGLEKYEWKNQLEIKPIACMAACRRSCAVTLAANHKLTFIFERIPPVDSAPELLQFIEQYVQLPDGKVPYRKRSQFIHRATSFILPPLANAHEF
jgi:predicted metal-binding protein